MTRLPKVCIVTSDFHVPGETFINRHIEKMFGGNTCIVAGRRTGDDPYGKPIFIRRTRMSGEDMLQAPFVALWNSALHGTSRHPFGAARRGLEAFLREQRVQVILAEFGTQALVMTKVANALGIPLFTYFRGTDASRALRSKKRVRGYRLMMPRLAGVLSVSQFLLDNLAAHGITHPNAHVMPSGVDVRRFVPGDKTAGHCLAVGRFVEKKAPKITLRAFAAAVKQHPQAHLTFIGDGPLLEPCKAEAATLGVTDKITFTGALPHEAVRDHLARAQIFLQHSITAANGNTEGLPTAIQEALSAGCIPVSTRHAGIPEAVIEGENGFLVEEWDETGFGEAILTALTHPDAARLAQTARKTAVERFDNDILLAQTEDILRAAIQGV